MHSTDDMDDGYLGSGKILGYSIRKHGRDKHVREIIEDCSIKGRAYLRERESYKVNQEMLDDPMCMNITKGGSGHPEHLSIPPNHLGKKRSKETCEKISRALKGRSDHIQWKGKRRPVGVGEKISASLIRNGKVKAYLSDPRNHPMFGVKGEDHPLFGVPRPDGVRAKISSSNVGKKKSAKHCENVSKGLRGRKLTDEHKKNISNVVKGAKYVGGTIINGHRVGARRVSFEEYQRILSVENKDESKS